MVKFSIVVTSYPEHARHLPRVRRYLDLQTFRDFETIVVEAPDSVNGGNDKRHAGLLRATGDYITWLSADNVPYAWWLQSHVDNFSSTPDAVSLVNIHYFFGDTGAYNGIMPRGLSEGQLDLMNIAMPRRIALSLDAFNNSIWNSDWDLMSKILNANIPIMWNKEQEPAGIHF